MGRPVWLLSCYLDLSISMVQAENNTGSVRLARGRPDSARFRGQRAWRDAKTLRRRIWEIRPFGYLACLLALALSGTILDCNARAAAVQAPNYLHHQVWSTEDGLPQASVHALLQSREGYLWIATEDGAARFDGQSFQVFSHATVPAFRSNDISCLAEDRSGDLWFGTSDGLVRKHGEKFRRFSTQDGLPSDQILALATGPDDVLVLTADGLAAWRSGHFESLAANETITSLMSTTVGPVLVSKRGTVYRLEGGKLVAVLHAPQNGTAPVGAVVGGNQAIWMYGPDFVQLSSPSQTKIWHAGVDLPGNRVQVVYLDRQGRAWIGTNRGLVSVGAAPNFPVHEYDALRGESVLSALVDREGDIWVGTEASGLHALQPRKFATVPGSNSEAVTTVARDSHGGMYFGTRDDGLFRDEGDAVPIATNRLTSPVILSLAAGPDGDIWAGTPDGLNQITAANVRHWTIADGLPDNFVRSVTVAPDGTVWAGTRFGLVHIAQGSVESFTTADSLSSDSIGPLLEGRSQSGAGVLWIGTSAGLCQNTGRGFRCLSSPYSGGGSIVTALGQDHRGSLWVALHGHGLGLVEEDRIVPLQVSAIPSEIVGILADNLGYLWLRSARGLFRARITDLRSCAASSSACSAVPIESYGRSDGMQSDELAGEGIVPLAEGSNEQLWFATRRGVAITDAQRLAVDPVPPGVVITQALVDRSELPLDRTVEVSPGHRQYSFQYAGLSLNNVTQCKYMLDGFDPGWVDAGTRRTAYYTNLPPRQYVFRVLCANRDGLWSKDEAAFRFRVLRPWYRGLWFYLAAACLVILAIFGFVQFRVRAERRRFALVLQERTRVAREVHDTLAQDLVSVSLQVEMAAQHAKAGRLNDVAEQLTRTRSLVRQALESARQSIWNLRANLSQDSLPVRLAARVEAVRDTSVSARLRISGEYRSTAAAVENEVMRIAGEAIGNAERHSGATQINVDLSYGSESLRLHVQDNGRGFDYAAARRKTDRYGLRGLEERAALLNAHLSVESSAGQGTTVTLIAPLSTERA